MEFSIERVLELTWQDRLTGWPGHYWLNHVDPKRDKRPIKVLEKESKQCCEIERLLEHTDSEWLWWIRGKVINRQGENRALVRYRCAEELDIVKKKFTAKV